MRLELIRDSSLPTARRTWAVGELACASLTLGTLTLSAGAIVAARFGTVPDGLLGWPMQVLLAGAVGYGTNFLAVKMLFQPRRRATRPPLSWIWPQGLIPAKQEEMATILGAEVASRLLTPEAVVDEVTALIEEALEDEATVAEIQGALLPLLEGELPRFLERFMPGTLDAARGALEESLDAEQLRGALVDVIDEWFAREENRARLARFLLDFFRARTQGLVKLVRSAVHRYSKTTGLRRLALSAGELTKLIDWKGFDRALRKQLDKPSSSRWAKAVVADFGTSAREFVASSVDVHWLEGVREGVAEIGLGSLKDLGQRTLIPRLVALLERDGFRSYLTEELIPRAKPAMVRWIQEGRITPLLRRFDVRGRVQEAAAALEIEEVEEMANRVGAEHLGAIQVLGYFLGLAAGVLIALLSSSAAA